jgi:hypothetical protein
MLVGQVKQQAQRRCLKGFKTEWINPYYAIGFSRLLSSNRFLAMYAGKIIVAYGTPKPLFAPPTVKHGDRCPPMQMRNDWVAGKHGMRLRRGTPVGAPAPSAFAVTRIERFSGLTVKAVGDKLRVALKNRLRRPLKNVVVVMHYEGCYGKPGAPHLLRALGKLAIGAKKSVTFPSHYIRAIPRGRHRARRHVAYSLQLASATPNTYFAFDVGLSAFLKTPPRCSKRGRKY